MGGQLREHRPKSLVLMELPQEGIDRQGPEGEPGRRLEDGPPEDISGLVEAPASRKKLGLCCRGPNRLLPFEDGDGFSHALERATGCSG